VGAESLAGNSTKMPRKPILLGFDCREGKRGGWGVSEVRAAFVTTLAGHVLEPCATQNQLLSSPYFCD
jgi:hypothetical protein